MRFLPLKNLRRGAESATVAVHTDSDVAKQIYIMGFIPLFQRTAGPDVMSPNRRVSRRCRAARIG